MPLFWRWHATWLAGRIWHVVAKQAGTDGSWQPDAGLLDALSSAAVVVDGDGLVRHANAAAYELFDTTAARTVDRPLPEVMFAEPEQGAVREILGQVLTGHRWRGELPVPGREGTAHSIETTFAPIRHQGEVVGTLLIAQELVGTEAHAHLLAERLTRLARVTAELLFADDVEAVTKIVIQHMADAAGATVASVSLLVDENTLQLIGLRGGRDRAAARWGTYGVHDHTPASEAVRTGRTVVLSGREEIHARFPDLEVASEGERSMVCLPLMVAGRSVGVATMSFPGRRTFDAAELEFFRVLADTAAQAIDRTRALEEAADQAAKLQFLVDASAELASSLDYESTLGNVARLAVPWFADWCSIALEQDGELRTIEVAHLDPTKLAIAEEYQRRFPSDPDSDAGGYQVLRTGRSELAPEITDEILVEAVEDPEQLEMLRELNFRSAMLVPLKVKDRVFGVITWVAGEGGRRFKETDLAFGEELARRAAVAIDNAQLHSEMREMASGLQRAVLPAALPEVAGWDMAARYLPAGRTDAGGDFYDVVALADDQLALFVGDVMGRGVHAAAAMAQMRSTLRTLVAVDSDPEAVLRKLDMLFEQLGLEQLVTMIYAVVDPGRDEMVIANAGHLAPVVLHADGAVEQLVASSGLLLGAGGAERSLLRVPFLAGDTFLIYTDGLIERRGEDIDVGQQRLADACAALATQQQLADGLTALIEAVRDPTRDDDVAALAVRRNLVSAVD